MDESNQVSISREIMRCQGYFFKIDLGTRLVFPHFKMVLIDVNPATFLRKKDIYLVIYVCV